MKTQIKNVKKFYSYSGNKTECTIVADGSTFTGFAVCSDQDSYCTYTGNKIAEMRALLKFRKHKLKNVNNAIEEFEKTLKTLKKDKNSLELEIKNRTQALEDFIED